MSVLQHGSRFCLRLITATAAFSCMAPAANAEVIGGVEFPQGAISFADLVVGYAPGMVGTGPTAPHRDPTNALGAPNYNGINSCASAAGCSFVSLGDGGSVTLRFVNNLLTGSGTSALDLWIFEVGPDVEDTFVEISTNGSLWHSVGKVGGSTAGVDLDFYGFGLSNQFSYVRLTDDTALDGQSGNTVGADIDAVGAISTVAAIPEPQTWATMLAGLLALTAVMRRRRISPPSRRSRV